MNTNVDLTTDLKGKRSAQERRRQLEELLRKKAEESSSFPLSFAQQRLWILEQLDPANPVYNIPLAIRLTGALNLDALNATLDELVARHESLRTRFAIRNEEPVQVVEERGRQKLTIVDLQHLDSDDREAQAMARALDEARQPFRLDQAPLLRVTLLRLSQNQHMLVVVMHHIISDGWSMVVLLREVMALYQAFHAGKSSPLLPLPIQYADYAVWQRGQLQNGKLQKLVDYWSQRLQDVPTLNLPTDRTRSPALRESGATETVLLPLGLANRLREIARREGATLYMLLLAAFDVLLGRYSGQDDFAVGSPVAGRIGKETEGVVGFFVNALAMRVNLAGDPSFRKLLAQVKQTSLDALKHQELPFERLVEALNPERTVNRHPLFQVTFSLENAPWPDLNFAGLELKVVPLDSATSKFDLSYTVRELREGLEVSAEFTSSLFQRDTMQRMLGHYQNLLEGIASNPDQSISRISMLSASELKQLLVDWNSESRDEFPNHCVTDLFERHVQLSPHSTALIDGARQWTYQELDERANKIAHCLRSREVGLEDIVAIRLPRSAELIAALWGVLKAGGAYLPLDPHLPAERLKLILEDAQVNVVITETSLRDTLPASPEHVICLDTDWDEINQLPGNRPERQVSRENLAYVIYTSGSTGRPKGVMIEHQALTSYTTAATELYVITAADRVLQFASVSFDVHVEEIYPCLTCGGTLVLRTEEMLDCREFVRRCDQWGVTFISLSTGFWHELASTIAREGLTFPVALTRISFGGESAQPERVALWFNHVRPEVRLLNTYGPTEATVICTAAELIPANGQDEYVPIGRALASARAYVLDSQQQPVPAGVAGELYIGGESLARGYLNRPDLTNERFVPDPFASKAGSRMYKTGDVVRWRPEGQLEYLTRTDHQVKIRGYRIELGEVETALRRFNGVHAAVVVVHESSASGKQLAAYVVTEGESPTASTFRKFLQQTLPDYMIPAFFVPLQSIPFNTNGKIDYKSLPRPTAGSDDQEKYVAPRTSDEESLAEIWRELLGADQVGIHDNFFELGGHSLLATQLVSRIARRLQVDLSVRAIFETPTIADLAHRVEALRQLHRPLGLPPIARAGRENPLPLSHGQEALWVISQLMEGASPYVTFPVARVRGALNIATLERALNEVVRRHESLRTTFQVMEGRPVQVIAPFAARTLKVIDLSGLPIEEREDEVERYALSESQRPIDLAKGPLARVEVLKLSADEHVLLVGMHHIIYDGWSMGVLNRELLTAYVAFNAGRHSPLPELPIQYADYATWQRERLQGEVLEGLRGYWLKKLDGLPTLELPTDRPRPAVRTTHSATSDRQLSGSLSQALEEFSRQERATPFMTLGAAFQVLLQRYTGQDEFPIGTPVAGRLHPETEGLIGYFVNTLVLRANLSGDPSFRELLGRVRETALEAFEHQELPFERLVQELNPPRDLSRHPVFQVMFVLQNTPDSNDPLLGGESGLELNPLDVQRQELANDFDLTLIVCRNKQGFHLSLGYNTDLFDETTIARMLGHLQKLLEEIVADSSIPVSRLPLLTDAESRQILIEWNQTQADYPQVQGLHEIFEEHAESDPDAIAVVFDGESLTFGQLNARANQLAHYLRELGVGPEVLVGVCLERSLLMPAALLAILKAGGAYVPLDPEYPRKRLEFMLEDSRAALVLSTSDAASQIPDGIARVVKLDEIQEAILKYSEVNPVRLSGPDNAIYVIYTSGSTGTPKGAVNLHRGLCNKLFWSKEFMGLDATDRILFKTPLSFDMSVMELFRGLVCGCRTVIARPGGHRDPNYLCDLIVQEGVTTAEFVPSMLQAVLEERRLGQCTSLKRVSSGGEALTPELVRSFFDQVQIPLFNFYGPTEASIGVTGWKALPEALVERVPIGRPVSNVRLYVLDQHLNPVPIGVPGELHAGGVAVGRGYLNRPELTAERFIPDHFSPDADARLYKTGDRCCYLPDGNILYLGRFDEQVKIRGFRIELGEIEGVLKEDPGLRDAVVVATIAGEGKLLAAYVVPHSGVEIDRESLRQRLNDRLPSHMIPSFLIVLDALPLTPSGKLDRRALPAPDAGHLELTVPYVAPRDGIEQELAAIWSQVLSFKRVGAHDNFFDLGGHSLSAVAVMSRINREFAVNLPLRDLFETPTIAQLASRIIEFQSTTRVADLPPILRVGRENPLPMSYGQEALWLVSQLIEGVSPYVTFPAARVRGPLNVAALERALNEVVRRHESLRTTFHELGGRPVQLVAPFAERPLSIVDLSNLPIEDREVEMRRYALSECQRPIDLARGPLVQAHLLKISGDEHVLLMIMHHIIYDGWSLGVMYRELLTAYAAFAAGRPVVLSELPIQYADFAVWQRERLQGEVLEKLREYWVNKLKGCPTLELPTDRPRPAVRTTHGANQECQLSVSLSEAVEQLGRQERATPFMTLAAAFQTLLHRYTGQEDFSIGTAVAGRLHPETEKLIGYFVNTLVLRANLAGTPSFRELLGRVRETSLEAFEHQELPFERLVHEINPPRDLSRHPLFQVMLVLQNTPHSVESSFGHESGLELSRLENHRFELANDFDLTMIVSRNAQGFHVSLGYNTDLFDDATIERMLGHFQTLLEGIVADRTIPVSRLPMLTAPERTQILEDWNGNVRDFGRVETLQQLVEEQVERTPQGIAVEFEGRTLTYRELNERANQMAHRLIRLGVGPDVAVGVCLERSLEMPISLLAILKAGGAYLPLDPEYPVDRLAIMIQDSQPATIISVRRLADFLPANADPVLLLDEEADALTGEPTENPELRNDPLDVSYILYTSGSTGRPKGVRNNHRGICNFIFCLQDRHSLTPDDRYLQKTPYSFDMSVYEFFWTLTTGARLVMARPRGHKDPGYIVDVIAECQITSITFVPSMLSIFLQEDDVERCRSLKRVICGGEALSYELQRQFYSRLNAELHNIYGPTEAAIAVTFWTCRENTAQLVPLGKTIPNIQCLVLDPARDLQPIGVPGELYLGGVGLARDYLNRPELSAEKFVPHPFSPDASARLYRTGDLCRYLPDGNILFLGRIDTQVKIRGHRIELGEIQAAVLKHPGIRDAVVTAVDNGSGGKELALYWVAREAPPAINELREFLLTLLPDYMVPTLFVTMESIPVNSNGKADLKALPAPSRQRDERNEYVAPQTPLEETLARHWRDVLQIERVGVHDNFFDLGGHSLSALSVVSRVNREFGISLALRELFAFPTIATLAAHVIQLQSTTRIADASSISRTGRGSPLPLSYGQEALWVINQLMEGASPYVTFPVARVRGELNVAALEQALNEVLRRHESLRTTFHELDGHPVQLIAPFTARPLTVVDLSGLPVAEREAEMERYARSESQRPIDLEKGPLARVEVLKISPDEHVLLVGMHHIIYDGWSMGVLNRELLTAYVAFAAGLPSPLPELPIQYADFAVWQRNRLQGEVLEGLQSYWLKKLEGMPTLELPTDRPRPAVRSINGAACELQLPGSLSQSVEEVSRQEQATPFMTLAAAFQALLQRYSGQNDFPMGTPVAGRLQPETEGLIGYFVNTLVLRADLSGDPSFRELLGRVRETSLEAFEHQELPFERLVQDLKPPRDPSRHPVFQVMFVLQNTPDTAEPFLGGESGLELNPLELQRQELANDFDLSLTATRNKQGFHLSLGYNTDLFDEGTITRMLGHFQKLLEGIVADSDVRIAELPILTDEERQQILVDWNDTARDFGDINCLHQLIEAQVSRTPDAIAVEYEGRELTYLELNERANQLAHRLVKYGVGPDVAVGVCLERSCELVVSLLAVLKAGGAYLPLDPDYPPERLALMVRDSQPAAVLSIRPLAGRLPIEESNVVLLDEDADKIKTEATDNPPFRNSPSDIAYIIYTSGSTGIPKGARNTHRGICNYILFHQDSYPLTQNDRVLQKTPFSFDMSTYEFFWPLIAGARLVVARPGGHRDPQYMVNLIAERQITTATYVPSMLSALIQEEGISRCRSLKRVFSGGETLTYEMMKQFVSRLDAELHNTYGPTEAAVAVTVWECRENPENQVLLGKPIPNTECYILDPRQNPLPVGVSGELCLGGVCLGRDYLNRPELTAEKFIPHPFSSTPGARLYRTGDRCRYLPDGNIQFLGRFDHQVKIRGFRIELGEIQAAILKHPGVREAVVTSVDNGSGGKELVTYWVAAEAVPSVSQLREFLLKSLPDYMVPTLFVNLEKIPVNANGKVDLKSLPAPSRQRDDRTVYVAPRTPLEEMLAKLWRDVLQIDRVGVHDNFFELGGHSLLALQVVSRAKSVLGSQLRVTALFAAPTIAALAERIETEGKGELNPFADDAGMGVIAEQLLQATPGTGRSLVSLNSGTTALAAPLFCIHGLGGQVTGFIPMANALADQRPIYGMLAHGLEAGQSPHHSIEVMATAYLREIREVQPRGPYLLAGWSMGGLIALEATHQLEAIGEEVSLLAMLDTYLYSPDTEAFQFDERSLLRQILPHLNLSEDALSGLPEDQKWQRIADQLDLPSGIGGTEIRRLVETCNAHQTAYNTYQPRAYSGSVVLLSIESNPVRRDPRWNQLFPSLQVETVPGNHYSMLRKPHVDALVAALRRHLTEASVRPESVEAR